MEIGPPMRSEMWTIEDGSRFYHRYGGMNVCPFEAGIQKNGEKGLVSCAVYMYMQIGVSFLRVPLT